jgi:hypothetical protein
MARETLPKHRDKVKVSIGWAPNIRRERVGLMLITLIHQGYINLSPEQLIDVLRKTSFPAIGEALEEQMIAGRIAQIGSVGPNNPDAIRRIAKDIIHGRN